MRNQTRRRLVRLGLLSALCSLVLSLIAANGALAAPTADRPADGRAPEKSVERKSETVSVPVRLPNVRRAGGERLADDPPPTCELSLDLQVDAFYVEGILTQTDSFVFANVECPPTAPDQTMARITLISKLAYELDFVAEGNVAECRKVLATDRQCLGAFSGTFHQCFGQFNCAGRYQGFDFLSLVLPRGWIWTEPSPEGCTILFERELGCQFATGLAIVPPTA